MAWHRVPLALALATLVLLAGCTAPVAPTAGPTDEGAAGTALETRTGTGSPGSDRYHSAVPEVTSRGRSAVAESRYRSSDPLRRPTYRRTPPLTRPGKG